MTDAAHRHPPTRRAFSLSELLALVLCVPVIGALGSVRAERTAASNRVLKDSTQVRGIGQGLILWAQNNNDQYVMPGAIDHQNTTLPADVTKDLPRNIASVLIFAGLVGPDLFVSPCEPNRSIVPHDGYAYSAPPLAAAPDKRLALWDPSFRAYPFDEDGPERPEQATGGLSYAFTAYAGGRRSKWSNTFQATEAVVGWRGPAYDPQGQTELTGWVLAPRADAGRRGAGSLRTLFPAQRGGRWSGNVAFNDNHVELVSRPDPETLAFTFSSLPAGRKTQFDNLFVNENDRTRRPDAEDLVDTASANTNNYLATWGRGTANRQGGRQSLADLAGGLWWD
ncbi:MAG: hypothetical protein SFY69_12400 [Planctomycetota bacterium]|nr:hypothetical protein [Planctomycetota bacterium]